MKNFLILWVFLLISISTAERLEYYWKDFDGYIPEDAFIAHLDLEPIYVGQGYFKDAGIFPATIFQHLSTITVTERDRNPVISKNIKILCTQNSNALQWIQVNYNDLKIIKNVHFLKIVESGTESDAPLYVGRILHEGTMQVAKVYNVSPYEGVNAPNKSGGGTNYKNF